MAWAAALAAVFTLSACGRVWLAQPERAAAGQQVLENPSLEQVRGGEFVGWKRWSKGGYEVDQRVRRSGRYSARCSASDTKTQYGVYQTVVLNQKEPLPIIARAWSKAENVSGGPDGGYSLYRDIAFQDGSHLWGQTFSFDTGTHDWQLGQVIIVPEKPIRELNIYGLFRRHTGTVWFDDFELYEARGLGRFDMVPASGELPKASGRGWLRLPISDQLELAVNTRNGWMTVLQRGRPVSGRPVGGIVVRNCKRGGPFVLVEFSRVQRSREAIRLEGREPSAGVEISAELTVRGGVASLSAEVRNLRREDNPVTVYWAVPLPEGQWAWHQPIGGLQPAKPNQLCGHFLRLNAGANSLASRWPLVAISQGSTALAVAFPIRLPRLCRAGFEPALNVAYVAWDLGLLPRGSPGPWSAKVEGQLFTFDARFADRWGYRAALARYYELNADSFVKRNKREGIWMPFRDISKVEGWQDFGFQFQEGAPNPAFDEKHGIYSFPYIEPVSFWMRMPEEVPRTEKAAIDYARKLAAKGDKRAMALFSSGFYTRDGRFMVSFHNVPWCNGALFICNPDPDIKRTPEAPVTQWDTRRRVVEKILRSSTTSLKAWQAYGDGFKPAPGRSGQGIKVQRGQGDGPAGAVQSISMPPGTRSLVASVWCRTEGVTGKPDGNFSLYLDLLLADGTYLYGQVAPIQTGTHDWRRYEVRVTSEKPIRVAMLHLLMRGDHYGTAWFDDVEVRAGRSAQNIAENPGFEERTEPWAYDGIYFDSLTMACRSLNYRRDHFEAADIPLVFDLGGNVCQLGFFATMELVTHVAAMMHSAGKMTFANGALGFLPHSAAYLDVAGTETRWLFQGRYSPLPRSTLFFWRAMCYQRPYLMLQNVRFEDFPTQMVEWYMARSAAMGMFPGMFSPEASGRTSYWVRPDLYNRDRHLFKRYIPVIKRIAAAGWQPVPLAVASDDRLWVERFGGSPTSAGSQTYITVFNPTDQPVSASVELQFVRGRARLRSLLPQQRDLGQVRGPNARLNLTVQPQQVWVLEVVQQ